MKTNTSTKSGVCSAFLVPLWVVMAIILTLSSPALSQGSSQGGKTAEEIADELADPNTNLGTLSFPVDFIRFGGDQAGASDENAYLINFQPSLPVVLAEGVNFFARPLIPIVLRQPVSTGTGMFEGKAGLGDISFDAAVGKSFKSGLLVIGGIVGAVPTATDDALGTGQFLLGPEGLVGYIKKGIVLGALFTQSWGVAGGEDVDTSVTGGQYFWVFNLKNAWQLSAKPVWSYNHKASDGNKLAFPLGVGVNKTVIAGKTPLRFSLQYWYYVASPDQFGPKHQLRFEVAAVIPLPW